MQANLPSTEDGVYAQVSQESISTWAETVGIADLSPEISRLLASDATYRLRQVLHSATEHLHACKRRRLSPDDLNRAMKWIDIPPVLGHSGVIEYTDWLHVPEVGVHVASDPPLNLASTALPGDIYHQPGNPCVKGEWACISNHVNIKGEGGGEGSLASLPLSSALSKYYTTLMSAIFGHNNTLFQELESDLSTNTNLGPLVGAIVSGCVRGAQTARQNPCILRRVLLTVRAILSNPHMHVGHAKYVRDIMSLVVFCVVTDRKQSHDTHPIRSLATNTMLKVLGEWNEGRAAWDVTVSSLAGVIASYSRPWSQHAGALTALLALGPQAQVSLLPHYSAYHSRLQAVLSPSMSCQITKEACDANTALGALMAVLVKITTSYLDQLPDRTEINLLRPDQSRIKKSEDCSSYLEANATGCRRSSSAIGLQCQDALTGFSSSICDDTNFSLDSSKFSDESIDDRDALLCRLREVYSMGERWFGSAFVLQIPTVYLCLHRDLMPNFLKSHLYKEMHVTGEALLREVLCKDGGGPTTTKRALSPRMMHRVKRRKAMGGRFDALKLEPDFSDLTFESLIGTSDPCLPRFEEVFQDFKIVVPFRSRSVALNIHGCRVQEISSLKRPKTLQPSVERVNRGLLFNNYQTKVIVAKMPHCKFSRPSQVHVRRAFSIHHLIL